MLLQGERLGGSRRRHVDLGRVLAVGAGISRFEIDDIAQQNFAFVHFVTPYDDRLKREGAFAKSGDHRLAASLDALGDGDFALARQEFDRAHFAQIHPDRIVGAIGGFGRTCGDLLRLHGLDQVAALRFFFLGGFLGRCVVVFLVLDDIDAHLAQHRQNIFDLLGIDFLGRKHGIQFRVGNKAPLLGELDHPLDGGIGEIEQGAVGDFDRATFRAGIRTVLFRHQRPPNLRVNTCSLPFRS